VTQAVPNVLTQARAAERLSTESVIWLTSVHADGQPQSSPVWFLWDGSAFWHRSQAQAGKVANIRSNPKVALHLSDDGKGGDIETVEGNAELVDVMPDQVEAAYGKKYEADLRDGLEMTFEQMKADYPIVVRVTPTRARVW
jgi:PPOX class probable F420-dependent enzyme